MASGRMEAGCDAVQEELPLPGVWSLGPGANFWAFVLVAPFLWLMLSAGALVGIVDGSVDHVVWACAAVAVALAVGWVMFVWLSRWKRRRRPVLEIAGAGGLLWRESRFHWMLVVIANWSVMLMGLLVAWAVWIDSGKNASEEKFLLSGSALVGVWGAWNAVNIVLGRARRGEVLLTHQGLEYRPRARTHCVGWDMLQVDGDELAARAVQPGQTAGGPGIWVRRRRSALSLPLRMMMTMFVGDPSRPLFVRASTLDGDPVQLVHALAWYAQHPEHRDELVDGRALARVSQGRAVVPELLEENL